MFDEAILFYNAALEITPNNEQAKILNQISACYKKEGIQLSQSKQYTKALQKFDLSIKMCTDNYSDKYSLLWWNANTLKQAGLLSEASINYKIWNNLSQSQLTLPTRYGLLDSHSFRFAERWGVEEQCVQIDSVKRRPIQIKCRPNVTKLHIQMKE